MKLIKRLIYLLALFFGLYYFGDFRINDVNVRDFLQRHVTPDQLKKAKSKITEVKDTVYQIATPLFKHESLPTIKDSKDINVKEMIGSQKTLENLTEDDQKKMLELLKNNLNIDLTKQQQYSEQVEQYMKRLPQGDK